MATPKLVVQEHAPWRQWIWVGVTAAVFGIGSYILYSYSVSQLPYEWEQLEVERSKLESERRDLVRTIRQLKAEIKRQAEEKVLLERGLEIDRESALQLKQSLEDMQRQLAAQEEQLAFYRGIVTPEQAKAGVRVYDFEVQDGGEPGLYLYDLILIQAVRHDKTVSGRVVVEIRGTQAGTEKRIPLSTMMLAEDKEMAYAFRYFQGFNGAFRLPKGFRPSGVHIKVQAKNRKTEVVRDFQWNVVQQDRSTSDVGK